MKRLVEEREVLSRVPVEDRERMKRWLLKQPVGPDLVSRKTAASILGVASPHLARFERQGRLPEPVPVEGGSGAYIREEIESLRDELERERQERLNRKKERAA